MKPLLLLGGLALLGLASPAHAQTATKILDNGPDAEKKVLVIIGDGFTANDMDDYHQYVQDKVLGGVFTQDEYFRENQSAFNIYRVDLTSPQSGVSIRRYSEGCGTRETTDDVVDTACNASSSPACYTRDTALDFVYTACWGRCWVEGTANTSATLKAILDELVPKRDLEVRVLNVLTGESGGCGGGGRLTVPIGASWYVLAHEMGHMVSNLYDEYIAGAYKTTPYPKGPVNAKNCSTSLSRTEVAWSDFLTPDIALPTTWDSVTMDPDETVGEFEGCATYGKGIYRPVHDCRMKGNTNQFCPVCRDTLKKTLTGFTDVAGDFSFYASYPGAACKATGTAAVSYTSAAHLTNPAATPATVLCPTRRVQENGRFTNHLIGQAFVVDQHPTEDVCCQLFARTPAGNVAMGANVCSTGSSGAYQRLFLDFPKVHMNYTFAHFALTCSIPAASNGKASSVITYRFGQQYY
ncbi:M64 family metallopeptidase [Cystobacter ferrugineus]|uniref:M64 family metallopeptidase n=1 Tax=Cystobacter ferrugineus TaxID=83449 RepID=UPI001651572C|nr:M64 family metallopeptidase [Cystobacter ferrugineus]